MMYFGALASACEDTYSFLYEPLNIQTDPPSRRLTEKKLPYVLFDSQHLLSSAPFKLTITRNYIDVLFVLHLIGRV